SFKEEECLEDAFILKRRFIPSYMRHLSSAMGSMFSCRIINTLHDGGNINRQRISFIGVGIDSKLACQTFYFLYEHMNRKCREKRLKGRDATDYKYGFAIVVARRCREMDKKLKDIPQESALVPLKDAVINSYVHRVYPNLTFSRQRTRDYSAAMGDGMADGEKVNLGRPIEKGADRVGISS
ncbi:MAG: hypothetical protein IJU40_00895, partial [Desulfovibrionaceae bacterium]|nr:hypothetical protein [Desulfovibrionaceae bacterium]